MKELDLSVYFIMGSQNALNPFVVLEEALRGGITCFQLREKGPGALTGNEKLAFAKRCQQLCKTFNVPFIVNDDVDLVKAIHADGVHVGQEDASASFVRQQLGADKIVGVSVHSIEEAKEAAAAGADYIGMGPVYQTVTKVDANPVSGTAPIEGVRTLFPHLPIVGIGGITAENSAAVIQAGANGAAVISAISHARDSEKAARSLAEAVASAQSYV